VVGTAVHRTKTSSTGVCRRSLGFARLWQQVPCSRVLIDCDGVWCRCRLTKPLSPRGTGATDSVKSEKDKSGSWACALNRPHDREIFGGCYVERMTLPQQKAKAPFQYNDANRIL